MATATWNGKVIAQSDKTIVVEGNHYFPRNALVESHFESISKTTVCGWKGTANYFDVVVDGERNEGAAWFYAEPKAAASEIAGYVAFWRGVVVTA